MSILIPIILSFLTISMVTLLMCGIVAYVKRNMRILYIPAMAFVISATSIAFMLLYNLWCRVSSGA